MEKTQDFDILEMPFDALAAYWLSVHKLLESKKGQKVMDEEIRNTSEPYIAYLLETVLSDMDEALARSLALARRDVLLDAYRRKIELMRAALFAMASGENPRVTVVRLTSRLHNAPMDERRAFEMASALAAAVKTEGSDLPSLLAVDHKFPADRLLVKLLFYVVHARREGKQALEPFIQFIRCPYFASGLALVADGFEADFLAGHLERVRNEALRETRLKMAMSLEMALGIRRKLPYAQLHAVARAYLP